MPVRSASTMTWNATISFRAANSRTPAPSHTALPRRPGCVRSSRSTLSPSPMAQTALTSAAAVPNPIAQSTTARTIRFTTLLRANSRLAPGSGADVRAAGAPLRAPGSRLHARARRPAHAPWGRASALQRRAPRHLRASRARWCDRPRSGSRNTARNCSIASCSRPERAEHTAPGEGDEAGGAGTALNQRRRAPLGRSERHAPGGGVHRSYERCGFVRVGNVNRGASAGPSLHGRQSGPGGSARAAALFDSCCRDLEPGCREQRADAFGREPRQRWRVAHLPQCFHRGPAVVALGQRSCALQLHLERGPLQIGGPFLAREEPVREQAFCFGETPGFRQCERQRLHNGRRSARQVRIALQHGRPRRGGATEQAHHRFQPRVHVPVRGIDSNTFRENRLCAVGPVQPEEPCVSQVAVERTESRAGASHLLPLLDGFLHHTARQIQRAEEKSRRSNHWRSR